MTGKNEEYQLTRQPFRCQKCETPFFGEMKVNCEVTIAMESMMANRCPSCGSKELYMGLCLSLDEDRQRRPSKEFDLLEDWKQNGDTGLSSEAIAAYMTEGEIPQNHPHDYSDLKRCLILLDRMPQWKARMGEMAKFKGWKEIGARWQEIEGAILNADPTTKNPKGAAELLTTIFAR